jgi:Leucine Rich repeat
VRTSLGPFTSLANALEANQGLIVLWLEDNSIDNEGAAALAEALICNTTLQELHLGNNDIQDEGAMALGGTLKVNVSVKKMGLYHNRIGDKGAHSLLKALMEGNGSLTTLDLCANNNISLALLSTIDKAVTANKEGTRSSMRPMVRHAVTLPSHPNYSTVASPRNAPIYTKPISPRTTKVVPGAKPSLPTRPASLPFENRGKVVDSDWMSHGLATQRAELELEIRRLAVIRDACMDTLDDDQWQESADAERRIHEIQKAISSGDHPTGDELEAMVKELTISVRDKVRNESVAAAMPLRDQLLQLQHSLAREREAEARVGKGEYNRPVEKLFASGKSRPPPPPYKAPDFPLAMESYSHISSSTPPPPPPPPYHPQHPCVPQSSYTPASIQIRPPRPSRPTSNQEPFWGFGGNADADEGLTFNIQLGLDGEMEMGAGFESPGIFNVEELESGAEYTNANGQGGLEEHYVSEETTENSLQCLHEGNEVTNEATLSEAGEYVDDGDYEEADEACTGDY